MITFVKHYPYYPCFKCRTIFKPGEVLEAAYDGEKAKEAKWRASKIAEMFESKIEYYRNKPFKSLL